MQHPAEGHGKVNLTLLLATTLGFMAPMAATLYRRCRKNKPENDPSIAPGLERTESGYAAKLEKFSHYVARQMGFADPDECPQLCKLAYDYLKKSKGCDENMYEYFSSQPDADSLYIKLVEELDRCTLSYFAFHWTQASLMINQVLSVESDKQKTKLKNFVMAATSGPLLPFKGWGFGSPLLGVLFNLRKQRFEKVTKDLKVTRVFNTLVEEMKAIGVAPSGGCTEVMMPVALSKRSPVLLLMGGGMGAGKSTVLNDIMKEAFWSEAAANAVVVEADAFKETDVIYRALSSHHHDMLQTAELVHQSSTDAASSLLVTALNEGRDVIMDGTLSWEPFVQQTIAMARNVHKCRYRMGVGYKVAEDGTVTENYWEQIPPEEEEEEQQNENGHVERKPYRIELVGVICDPYLAVVRGIRRAIMTKRAVRVNSQLKSHKRFASAFQRYCQLVDNARLYCTNAMGGPPSLIGWKDGDNKLLVDPEQIKCLTVVSTLKDDADNVYELYTEPKILYEQGSVWKDIVLTPSRASLHLDLRTSIQKIENAKK
ncbi:hypothetical protein CK203_001025 [Vitis vinifera]|uniref:Zeta toxin domain-containing protein n=1 Tax=Vitis vinifera TaxID=29760 RepID=A0A438KKG0_VITVI|nr:hypothetical protein CK203_001025 [Vitis vinifera]